MRQPSLQISPFSLLLFDALQGAFGFLQRLERVDAQGSGAADAAPFAYQIPAAEERGCEMHRIENVHLHVNIFLLLVENFVVVSL